MDIPEDQLEVYTQFGIAAELAQCLEMDAGNVALAYVTLFVDTDRITPDQTECFRSLVEDLNRKTLGQLLRSIKKLATYGDEVLETVDEALVKRNYLMHRFFSFHNFALFSVEGRREMLAELDEIQKKLSVAHDLLNWIYDTLHMLAGRSPEDQDCVRERLLARGRRLRGFTNEP